ncbi:4-hydroxybutyryl-CoA dehydratase / vinylacetyl-CoA-Delta-isomerase [Desulfatibacillum alkenivorans DSM 16219]|jgi:4-hydroxybutyryl-CoA dehydratase/vinylacetyl-CoA-Delta-isomerase|uniref:4-hydroxybutyryl-CoA dehydratase / vinylacetyl-CoA-Delta-isomerase n=1 Tax=Desulfatibacillum alkenivorans DSM 16219 TaxID=1121393 RepID=A0A1M6T626_9BACT|nr:4-hydroxyphenylacetate 3-hydroxylase N-terminal domain-containing protein [Desulfatibacillum alkenivorans]SHK52413.1 4-hydroxybutyryl-CoA dehydratase / vinylacetyl-CoA-Delta-isomerase [Desulfatibacillum alkenivorans DSM 16219]
MGIKTGDQYVESLRKLSPTVYIGGEKITSVVDSPFFATPIREMKKFYDWQSDPETKDDFTFHSPITNETVGFWTHLRQTPEELLAMVETMKRTNARHFCSMCMGIGLSVLWGVTWEIDRDKNTTYHANFRRFFEHLQKEDLRYCLGVMDPKGDRSLPPSRQPDPDLYLRVAEKRDDGIIVRGAKAHTSNGPITHYFFAMPCRAMGEDDADYCLSFAIPVDAPGISFITRPAPGPLAPKEFECPVSTRIGFTESLTVFDDVFIPWENVFMCGEWEYTQKLIGLFSPYVRFAKGTCTSARIDILAGTAALIAQANGVPGAGHVRSKITDMANASEIGYGCAIASVQKSVMHESGIPIPDNGIANAGLYHTRTRFAQFLGTLQEIAGGIVTTMPTEQEYSNPEIRPLIDKYFQASPLVTAEDRMRILYLIQELTASRWSGYLIASAICAGGTPETNRMEVARNYNLLEKMENVKAICGIN